MSKSKQYIEITIMLGKRKRKVIYKETGERPRVGDAVNIKGEGAEWTVSNIKVLDHTPFFVDFKKRRKNV